MRAIMYHNRIIYQFRKCLLCDTSIINLKKKEIYWETIFTISTPQFSTRPDIEFFTICPKCRIKSIQTIYNKIIERNMANYKVKIK
jgi:hypothetical protein